MWPLCGRDVALLCGADVPAVHASTLFHAIALGDARPSPDELFVAIREAAADYDGHTHVVEALEVGAPLAIVAKDWEGLVALAPDLRARCLVVDDTLVALRLLAARARRRFATVVAVAGSNGKTTTKEMLAAALSGASGGVRAVAKTPETMNGWTGVPATLTQRVSAGTDTLVVEIGIDAVGAMADHAKLVDADVAVITALGPEHLEGLGDEATAAREELVLFEWTRGARIHHVADPRVRDALQGPQALSRARAGDVIVCPARDAAELARTDVAMLAYDVAIASPRSIEVELDWRPVDAAASFRRRVIVPMAGRHNGANFACAFAAGLALGRSADDLVAGFERFVPPAMRCDVRRLADDCVLVDDAYNASPESMRVAFELLLLPNWAERPRVAILGDMLDLGAASERHHLELCEPLRELVANGGRAYLFGSAMRAVHRALADRGIVTAHLPADADPRAFLDDDAFASLASPIVLVKGSRGMALERVVWEIVERSDTNTNGADDLAPFVGRFRSACVTGTNGKTTTTSLIAAIVGAAGEVSCRVTTLGSEIDGVPEEEDLGGAAFVRTLHRATERGVRTLAIETTSHALQNGFTKSWPTNVGVFTNLSRDHLDYHGTPERYLAAKAQLFIDLPSDGTGSAVFNVADPASALLEEVTPLGVRRFGYAARPPDPSCSAIPLVLAAEDITIDEDGTHARLSPSPFAEALGGRLDLALVGSVHVENALAAVLAGHALGFSFETIAAALARFTGVPGRFQIVGKLPTIVVDFAHTPDALARTLGVARSLVMARRGKVVLVFGCGGDRDPGKRGEMGAIAARNADVVVITSDNPRSEDPNAIADAVDAGTSGGSARCRRIIDRAEAIRSAVVEADTGDIVVIAGKGHEKTQRIGDRELPFDDVVVAREAAASRT